MGCSGVVVPFRKNPAEFFAPVTATKNSYIFIDESFHLTVPHNIMHSNGLWQDKV